MSLKTATLVAIVGIGLGLAASVLMSGVSIVRYPSGAWRMLLHLLRLFLIHGSLLVFLVTLYRKQQD